MILSSEVYSAPSYRTRMNKTLGAAVLWVGSELNKDKLASTHCRWCEPMSIDTYVRNHWKWQNIKEADQLSNVLAFGIIPLTGLGLIQLSESENEKWESSLLLAEVVVYSSLFNQFTKFTVARERPFVHALPEAEKNKIQNSADNNVSFYSGHSNLTFAIATVISQKILRGDSYSPYWKWSLYSLAAATGYLRIAADKHYISDVLIGALSGTLFAYTLTSEETHKGNSSLQFLASPNSITVSYQF